MHHIFVDKKNVDLIDRSIIIRADEDFENYNHLVSSLRIKLKENVLCSVIPFNYSFDYRTVVDEIDKKKVKLLIAEETKSRELPVVIHLNQGIIKNDKFEFVIEKAVELGVNTIVPVKTDYSIVKYNDNDKKVYEKLERFNKIAKSAAEQSKRNIIPTVMSPMNFNDICVNNKGEFNIIFYENETDIKYTHKVIENIKKSIVTDNVGKKILNVYIGPEGGFSDREINIARENKFEILTLGNRILRTETVALNVLSIIIYELEC